MFVRRSKLDLALDNNFRLAHENSNLRANYDRVMEDADELLAKYREVKRQRDEADDYCRRLQTEVDNQRTRIAHLIEELDAAHNWVGGFADKYRMVVDALSRDVSLLNTAWHGVDSPWPWEEVE